MCGHGQACPWQFALGKESTSKYAPLLRDSDLVRWVANLRRGSAITAEVSLRRVSRASEIIGLAPTEMVKEARNDLKAFQDRLEDMVAKLLGGEKTPRVCGRHPEGCEVVAEV